MLTLRDTLHKLKERVVGKEVTVYPTYGYRDSADTAAWIVPMRVWVHDNRDTPFVEEMIERWASRRFARDIGRALSAGEQARLRGNLQHFIADDKSNDAVSFAFVDDPERTRFDFLLRTTRNGVIEENVRVPAVLVEKCYTRRGHAGGWLQIDAATTDGHGRGLGAVRFLEAEGLSVVSDVDDTIKITEVPAGKTRVLRNSLLLPFRAAAGMRERYVNLAAVAEGAGEACFHYVSGSPWQLYQPLARFLFEQESFPEGTVHMKNLRKNLLEPGALDTILAFALGGDLATLEQKVRQITHLMMHLPRRDFILIGDSGEKDPEVYRAIANLFPGRVRKILIRDVQAERLAGMERITGPDVPVVLDMSELVAEMESLIVSARVAAPGSPQL